MSASVDSPRLEMSAAPFARVAASREDWRNTGGALLCALLVHIALVGCIAHMDSLRTIPPTAAQEIPVEVIVEPPPASATSQQNASSQRANSASQSETAAKQATVEPQKQGTSEPPPAPSPQSTAPGAAPSQARATPRPPPRAQTPPPQAVAAEPSNDSPPQSVQAGVRAPPPVPVGEVTAKPSTRKGVEKPTSAVTAEFAIAPDSFHRAAAPAADKETNDDYKAAVFDRLDRFKIEPPAARARNARGVAVVSFMLDAAGNVVLASLMQSTGDRELDTEALAMVRRAAPFPKPPPGATLSFTPLLRFGED